MKEIQVSLWEMTKEEAAALPDGEQYLVYNPVFNYYRVETAQSGKNKQDIAKIKTALPKLIYLSFDGKVYEKEGVKK